MIPAIFERLLGSETLDLRKKDGFFGMCARAMRHILVEIYEFSDSQNQKEL